jgi:HSP90 family molecular chaperone
VLFLQVRRWVRTKVMLHPKEDQLEHVEEKKLRDLVKKHSEFVSYPISFRTEKASTKQVSDYEDEEVDKAGEKKAEEGKIYDVAKKTIPTYPSTSYLPTLQPTYPHFFPIHCLHHQAFQVHSTPLG